MTDYARARFDLVYSTQSDYGRPMLKKEYELELTPDEVMHRRIEVAAAGTAVDVNEFATVTGVAIYNLDASTAVQVDWTSATAATASAVSIAAGSWNFITDFDPAQAFTLTSASGNILVELIITGT